VRKRKGPKESGGEERSKKSRGPANGMGKRGKRGRIRDPQLTRLGGIAAAEDDEHGSYESNGQDGGKEKMKRSVFGGKTTRFLTNYKGADTLKKRSAGKVGLTGKKSR